MEKLSKDAAERLLVQAVKLQFSDGDPFAIHLLVMSSLRICRDVRARALDNSVVDDVDELLEIIRPEARQEFFREFYSIASFLKHAERDLDSLLDFPPDLPKRNEFLILLAVWTFQQAFKAATRNFIVHAATQYYRTLYPIILPVSNEAKKIDERLSLLDTAELPDAIRKLVKEGPSFLGPQPWISDWAW